MTLENPKRVGPGLISAPSQSRGIADTRLRGNPQSQQQVELSVAAPLGYDNRRRLSLLVGSGLGVDSSGRLVVESFAASSQVANYLTDAPSDGSEYVRLNGAWSVASGGVGSSTFTALTDTPGSYTTAGNAMRVNSGGTALEENDWLGAICIWGEENSTIGTNTYEYAFGNGGNPDIEGPVIPFDYEVLAVGASGGSSGTWELRVQRNGSNFATDAIVTVTAATRGYATFSAGSRPQGNAGDTIVFRSGTVTSSPAAPNVASCWIKPR